MPSRRSQDAGSASSARVGSVPGDSHTRLKPSIPAASTKYVVLAVGMDGFNRVWESPETLPTRAELADPASWLRRMG